MRSLPGAIVSTATRDLREGHGVVIRDNKASELVRKVLAVTGTCIELVPDHARDIRQHRGDAVTAGEYPGIAAALEQVVIERNCRRMPVEFGHDDDLSRDGPGSEELDTQPPTRQHEGSRGQGSRAGRHGWRFH